MRDCSLFSLDVQALYPSLCLEICQAVIYELVASSTVELRNIDQAVAKKLLWFTSTEDERRSRGIDHLASVRVNNVGRRPTLNGFFEETANTWDHNNIKMTQIEERRVIATIVSWLSVHVMGNHPVTAGGKTFV